MGEHGTWFDYLNRFSWWRGFDEWARHKLGRSWEWQMFGKSGWTLTHVLITLLVLAFVTWGALAFFRGTKTADKGIVPPRKMNLRNFFEYTAESVYGMVEGAMGEANAARFFPIIGALWMFILFGNLVGLIPGFVSPNDTLKTNIGIAVLVFVLTHVYGIKEQGVARYHSMGARVACVLVGAGLCALAFTLDSTAAKVLLVVAGLVPLVPGLIGTYPVYFKHFLGPSPVLIPLMLPIELISHVARPMSLAVRLMGNMMADHKVVMSFFALVPILVPLPFLILGLLICYIQALVFSTLAMVYIGMAIEHEEH